MSLPTGLSEDTVKLLDKKTHIAIIKVLCGVICFVVATGGGIIYKLIDSKEAMRLDLQTKLDVQKELNLQAVKDSNEDAKEQIKNYQTFSKLLIMSKDEEISSDIIGDITPRKSRKPAH